MFILSDVFPVVAVVIAKAPYWPMRPEAERATDSEAMRARGIIVSVKSNQLVKKVSRQNIVR